MTFKTMSTREVGRPLDRVDGPLKVTGRARYSAEFPEPYLAYGVLVRSTVGRGRIKSIDTKAAEQSPGVLAVLTHENAPRLKKSRAFNPGEQAPSAAGTELRILNIDEIHWFGQPVAVVVAETQDQAEEAASLVKVTYADVAPPVLSLEKEKPNAKKPKDVSGEKPKEQQGDAEAVLAASPFRIDQRYHTPVYNHNAIEPHTTVAFWTSEEALTVYDSTQFVHGVKKLLAEKFSLKEANVRVLAPFVGGGFGGKGNAWPHVWCAAAAAKVVGRPVKIELPRRDQFYMAGCRSLTDQRVALGADTDGKLTSIIHTGYTAMSDHNMYPEELTLPVRQLYDTPNFWIEQWYTELNMVPNTFMRAPGFSVGSFALESALDELAWELNMDPVTLRFANEPAKNPTKHVPFTNRNLRAAYEIGAEKFGWDQRGARREGEWLIGQGVASAVYHVLQRPAKAQVVIYPDGTAVVRSGTHEMGMGTATVQAQHAADQLGLPIELVHFEYGDTLLPETPVTGGSATTITIAAAVTLACEDAKKQLLKLARQDEHSPLRGASYDDLDARKEGLWLKSNPLQGETYLDILARHPDAVITGEGNSLPMLKELVNHKIASTGSYGAQFCEVRVHADTGEVQVTRWVGVFDCGTILNAKTARSQFLGGITMGIGMALWEETIWDQRTGRIPNATLAEYHVPVAAGLPAIEVHYLDIPDPATPLGAHGIGEIGVTGVAAAIANAVFHATGKRVRELPITPDKLL